MSTLITPQDAVAAVRGKLGQRWAEAVRHRRGRLPILDHFRATLAAAAPDGAPAKPPSPTP
ncbi:hypothetical protein Asp14428_74230 [Actinoplanes sp. NBRC 14428]|nr:hypothetical protein Asp14428_74230 [Actinoplanes sp. NBRC 14428]